MIPLSYYIMVAIVLIGVGVYGITVKRNLIRILISAEIIGNGVNMILIAFSTYSILFTMTGQTLALLIIVLSAGHTALGLALIMLFNRRYRTVDLDRARELRG
nr:NADH-quinone oxidoreductase subunit NuoK [Candidatus Njordarchaeota archaeon]